MLIQRYQADAVSLQKISQIDATVIKEGEIDDPLAIDPPRLINAEWDNGTLRLTLDRPVSRQWVMALQNMGNYTSMMGAEPHRFAFNGNVAIVPSRGTDAQGIINYFKSWLPQATQVLRHQLREKAQQDRQTQQEALRRARQAEEARLQINSNLKV